VALAALLLYLLLVLALDARVARVTLTWPWVGAAFVIGTVAIARGLGQAERLSAGTLVNVALLALALLAGLLVADLGTSA
jgi:hypothetical protein